MSRSNLWRVASGVTACGLLYSAGAKAQTRPAGRVASQQRYTDTTHHFSVVAPPAWTVNKELIPRYAVFVEPNKSAQDERATIGTYGEPVKNLTLDQYIQATKKGNATQKGLTVYDEKSITLGGLPAHVWRMRVSLPDHATHENRQVFGLRGTQAIILTLTALPADIKNYEAAFDALLASFRWEGGKTEGPPKPGGKPMLPRPPASPIPARQTALLKAKNNKQKE